MQCISGNNQWPADKMLKESSYYLSPFCTRFCPSATFWNSSINHSPFIRTTTVSSAASETLFLRKTPPFHVVRCWGAKIYIASANVAILLAKKKLDECGETEKKKGRKVVFGSDSPCWWYYSFSGSAFAARHCKSYPVRFSYSAKTCKRTPFDDDGNDYSHQHWCIQLFHIMGTQKANHQEP